VENQRRFESVFSKKVRAGKRRTYFFDVRQTKGEDYYLTLTESTKKFNSDGYERHKIFLYKEDFNRFMAGLEETLNHIKTELMPDYDYDEYTRRHEEWEKKRAEEAALEAAGGGSENSEANETVSESANEDVVEDSAPEPESESPSVESEDDMSW